jgi:hypothetical protein
MAKSYEEIPTLLGFSEEEVGVIAGGVYRYRDSVMLHEPTDVDEFTIIHTSLVGEVGEPVGVGFPNNSVSTITVSGLLKWTHALWERGPQGRQDVKEIGPVRIELFDEEETRQYIEDNIRIFRLLGIKFTG